MSINASEISSILKNEIKDVSDEAKVSEVGTVLTVGDGIARVYGLDNVQAGEMVEFPGKVKGMALILKKTTLVLLFLEATNLLKKVMLSKEHNLLLRFQRVNLFLDEL